MFKRNITVNEVKLAIQKSEIIASYLEDKPYPSFLVLGYPNNRPLHVVIAKDTDENCIIVTAYEPDRSIRRSDFRTKNE